MSIYHLSGVGLDNHVDTTCDECSKILFFFVFLDKQYLGNEENLASEQFVVRVLRGNFVLTKLSNSF